MAKSKSRSTSKSPKMAGRINVEVDKDSSMSIRQIENGFIVSESGFKGKGKNKEYYSKEFFTKANPVKSSALNVSSGSSPMKLGGKK